jgi:metal-dependent amidase/aminoacylase/carboxypeptidase family protein
MDTQKILPSVKTGKGLMILAPEGFPGLQIADFVANAATYCRLIVLSAAVFLVTVCDSCAAESSDAKTWTKENMPALVGLYRHLHQNPELSQREKETSVRMAKELQDLGIKVTSNVGGFGVVGVLENGPGKVVLLRSDLDGLPVTEQTGLPYASKVRTDDARGATVGVMHACGHDVHMSNLIGVARYLKSHRDRWSGTVLFVFQPAEEMGSGADAMIADGMFKRFPRADFAVALHDSADLATGEINYLPGFAMAMALVRKRQSIQS